MELVLIFLLGFGGGWYVHTPDKFDCKDDAQIIAACPPLTKMEDPTFGGYVLQLQIDSGQYRECRQACLPAVK